MWLKLIIGSIFLLQCSLGWCGIDFDGVDDYASTSANNFLDSYQAGSIAFWFKADAIADGNKYAFGSYGESTDDTSVMYFRITDTGVLWMGWKIVNSGGQWGEITASTTDLTGNTSWHLVVFSCVGGTTQTKIYLDGAEETASYVEGHANGNPGDWFADIHAIGSYNHFFTIGALRRNTVGNDFNGVITEVTIWSSALSASEVLQLYNAKLKGFSMLNVQASSVVEHWSIDEQEAGSAANGDTIFGMKGGNNITGDDGANNTGCSWYPEIVLSYPPSIIGAQ